MISKDTYRLDIYRFIEFNHLSFLKIDCALATDLRFLSELKRATCFLDGGFARVVRAWER